MSRSAPLTIDRERGTGAGHRPLKIAVFSPIYGVSGPVAGLRWWFLSRYLTELGADVTVFHQTPFPGKAGNVTIAGGAEPREVFVSPDGPFLFRLSYRLYRLADGWFKKEGRLRTLGKLGAERVYLLACSGRRTVKALDRHYRTEAPDVIVASCVGWGGVTPALTLRKRGIPFLLEFRDPWRSYHPDTWPHHYPRLRRAAEESLALVNVTPLLCERDAADFGKESLFFPHGFPPELLELRTHHSRGAGSPAGPLTVGYFGAMLYPHFDYPHWFRGLASVAPGTVQFEYAGRNQPGVRQLIREAGVEDRATASGPVGLWEVFPRQCALDALLMFASNDPGEPELFGFKSVEIRAAGRPVLVVGPKNDRVRAYLAAAARVLWASSPAEVAAALNTLADEKRRRGEVNTWTDEAVIRDQCWDRLAGRLLQDLYRRLPAQK